MERLLKFSVITPSYNQASFIEQTLLSVKEQNYCDLEHIVVDGASKDGTVQILQHYASRAGWSHLRWISEPDHGQTAAINKGFRMGSGDIFAYLCADDFYSPAIFSFVNSYFQEHPKVDLIYGHCTFTDVQGKPLRHKKAVPFEHKRLLRGNFIWQPAVFFRALVWKQIGPLNEALHYAMDYEYWLRAARECRIAAIDRHIAFYRFHQDSKSIRREKELLHEAYCVASKFGGGGVYSWYLHHVYWPNTSGLKRRLFSLIQR